MSCRLTGDLELRDVKSSKGEPESTVRREGSSTEGLRIR